MSHRRALTASSVLILVTLATGAATAQDLTWPEAARDRHHLSRAEGVSNITTPAVAWSAPMGGRLAATALTIEDVTGDGVPDIVLIDGGRVLARSVNDVILWDSVNLSASRIFGVYDLDRDGVKELLVLGGDQLYILDGRNGAVRSQLWAPSTPPIKVTNLDEDADLELLVRNRWTTSGVRAYDFAAGIEAPTLMWEKTDHLTAYGFEFVVGDLDGDFRTREIISDHTDGGSLAIYDAATGAELRYRSERLNFGAWSYGHAQIVNVDDDPQNEFLFTGTRSSAQDNGSIQITVYDYVNDAIQWHYEFGHNNANTQLLTLHNAVVDLNNDGSLEVVVSVFNDAMESTGAPGPEVPLDLDGVNQPDRWVTLVFDAATGGLITHLVDQQAVGILDISGDGTPELVVQKTRPGVMATPAFTELAAYRLDDAGVLRRFWLVPDGHLITTDVEPTAIATYGHVYPAPAPATIDSNGDGLPELLVVRDTNADGDGDTLQLLSAHTASPTPVRALPLPAGRIVAYAGAGNGLLAGPHLALRENDGRLVFYDLTLQERAAIRYGGFAATAIAIQSAAGTPRVVAQDSQLNLVGLDPMDAAPDVAPAVAWSSHSPVFQALYAYDRDEDGAHEVLFRTASLTDVPILDLLDASGQRLWSHRFEGSTGHPFAFTHADLGGDATLDLAFMILYAPDDPRVETLDGATGELLGSYRVPADVGTYKTRTVLPLPDQDGDGVEDLYVVHASTFELVSGASMTRIGAPHATGSWGYNATVADIDGDGVVELFSNAGSLKDVRETDGSLLWGLTLDAMHSYWNTNLGFAGITRIDPATTTGWDLVVPGQFGDLAAYRGADGVAIWRMCLSDGELSPILDGIALTATACDGRSLTSIATADIDDDGDDDLVLGSADGNLYAVDAQTGQKLWSFDLRYPLTAPILVDTDGDGRLDVVVGSADGNLYAIAQARLPAPASVREVALDANALIVNPGTDVDASERTDALGFAWTPVAGASGYRFALLSDNNTTIVPSTDVQSRTEVVVTELKLVVGRQYRVQVEAYGAAAESSPPAVGDGVTIVDLSPPTVAELLVDPPAFNPNTSAGTTVTATLADLTGLDAYAVEVRRTGQDPILYSAQVPLRGATAHPVLHRWDGRSNGGAILADGAYTLTLRVTDLGQHDVAPTRPVTLDSVAPPIPTVAAPAAEALTNRPLTVVSGTAEPGATVRVFIDDTQVCTTLTETDGTFNCTSDREAADGTHTVSAQAVDAAGNVGQRSDAHSFQVDATPPAAPTLEAPAHESVIDTPVPDLAGRAEVAGLVRVKFATSDRILCQARALGDMRWTCASDLELEDREHAVVAIVTDAAGNDSPPSNTLRFTVDTNDDIDDDGLPNGYELTWNLDPANPADANLDPDNDGLSNLQEFTAHTLPRDADSDDDGVKDGDEPSWDLDPDADGLINALDADADNDGLLDGTELGITAPGQGTDRAARRFVADADPTTTTDPLLADTDRGNAPDGAEDWNLNGRVDPNELDPNDDTDDLFEAGPDDVDILADADADGLTDLFEQTIGADPNDADTDDDGLADGDEPNPSTDDDGDFLNTALDPDADNDGLPDGLEAGIDAALEDTNTDRGRFIADAQPGTRTSVLLTDSDRDGQRDGLEDTDRNGRVDGDEGDPRSAADQVTFTDTDNDGLSAIEEAIAGTSDTDADSDDDGVRDGDEPNFWDDHDSDGASNAADPDADGDSILDGTEHGLSVPDLDTDRAAGHFTPDADPSTRTAILLIDTDGDGFLDGEEDGNANGRLDANETDPLDPRDPDLVRCDFDFQCVDALGAGFVCNLDTRVCEEEQLANNGTNNGGTNNGGTNNAVNNGNNSTNNGTNNGDVFNNGTNNPPAAGGGAEDDGCGCAVPTAPDGARGPALLVVALVAFALRRRR